MTARCGSNATAHVARRCPECKRIYARRYSRGEPLFRERVRIGGRSAECVFCGLVAHNSIGVKVLRYPLLRHINVGKHTSICIGSLGICDNCVVKNGMLNDRVRIDRGNVVRDDGLRSHDGMPASVAS